MAKRKRKGEENPLYDVFISHSSKDKSYADAIVHQLEDHGIRCWVAPRDIVPGSEYGEAIISGIESCRAMVLVFSKHANESPQIIREVERAVHHRMSIVPFRIENAAPKRSLEYFISAPHWLDAFNGPLEGHLDYLVKTLEHILGKSETVPKPPISRVLMPSAVRESAMRLLSARKTIAVGAVLIFLGTLFLRFLLTPAPVESVFLGKWQTTVPNSSMVIYPEVSRGGKFRVRTVVEEIGQIDLRRGLVYLIPNSGLERLVTWEPIDDSTVRSSLIPNSFWQLVSLGGSFESLGRISSLATKAVWTRTSDPKRAGVLIWKFDPNIAGQDWKIVFETGPNTTYRFRAELDDFGTFRAKEGKWTFAAVNNKVVSGQYEVLDENSISMGSALGQSVWKRRK